MIVRRGHRRSPILIAAALWLLAGCGTEHAPSGAVQAPTPALPPGQVMSCPPDPPPSSGAQGKICVGVPEPCSPGPCGANGRLTVRLTGFGRWTAPDGGPGYRFRWRIDNPGGRPLGFDGVDLTGADLSSIVDVDRQIRTRHGCGADRPGAEVPPDRTVTAPGPACLPTKKGGTPREAVFHFTTTTTPGGPQMVVRVPLTPKAEQPGDPGRAE